MTSFMEKMKDSLTVAMETFGLKSDAVVVSDDMLIVMNPSEKRSDAKSTHGGYAGKSLIETIREDLDTVYSQYKASELPDDSSILIGLEKFSEGMCQALGTLRGTSCDEEWKMMEYRYEQKQERG